ncbi:hypothetical protein CC78DRAFT_575518 [Lojkania enalia]|uniref:2EXR domain-containing protein n=1 Tax=Lojkania enalia TaxID=147567 RepID=A0A9P4KIH8_9PLEO|nr:hypothetical protein CC78DRAFT_575518 [Didymosphaeria enalia]
MSTSPHPQQDEDDNNVNLSEFHLFGQLPRHLRAKIWTFACPPPRTRFLEIYAHTKTPYTSDARIRFIPRLCPLFHTTSESRAAIMAAHGGRIVCLYTRPKQTWFYFNFERDILFLSSRFSATDEPRPNETYRLRELECLMPYQYLSQVRRLAVTYSGTDDYSRIALVLRWLKRLETLYVPIIDWWSSRPVKRLVRQGFPSVGDVSDSISSNLEDLEGEETEDEDEDEVGGRVERKVRVTEVELRLDEGNKDYLHEL